MILLFYLEQLRFGAKMPISKKYINRLEAKAMKGAA